MNKSNEADRISQIELKKPALIIITGLSGAGKSTAMRVFDDLGYYCVDNLPPGLIPDFYSLYTRGSMSSQGVVIASDIRSGDLFGDFKETITTLKDTNIDFVILYLDCFREKLINRFKEVRRSHPLEPEFTIRQAIEEERRRLEPIRAVATHVIDTSRLDTAALREEVIKTVTTGNSVANIVRFKFVSFGFKYGVPTDADYVFDVRFLPNPFYVDKLKSLSGKDADVYNYVMGKPEANAFFNQITQLINITLDPFVKVGKFSITIAIGCTGGRHRSVAFTRRLASYYENEGRATREIHRDLDKPQ